MNNYDWPIAFREIHEAGVKTYRSGKTSVKGFFPPAAEAFLDSIGCTAQELFDFIEDLCCYGEPAYETALLVTAVRRDYFLTIQKGKKSGNIVSMDSLPAKTDAVDGIAWLPRLIVKARAKLRGEMPPDLMYGCGGDRPFLRGMNVELSDFLRVVWAARDDDRKVIDYVKAQKAAS